LEIKMEIFIVFYRDTLKEESPSSFFNEKWIIERNKNLLCGFIPLDYLGDKTWKDILDEIRSFNNKPFDLVVFAHNLSGFYRRILSDILSMDSPHIYIDYSGGDPSYHPMWEEIRNAKDITELVETLEYWKRSYVIDPLRRIKHRAINLFLPISTDIQFLLEIWRRKDFSRAKTHIEDLKADWCDDKSPVSTLYRLWYMLFGDHLNWKEGDLPEMPTDVSLPIGKKPNRKKEPLSLYDWLDKYFGEKHVQDLKEWQKLLAHAQIHQLKERKFNVLAGNGVYCFSRMITEMIKYPGNIKPNEKFNGFRLKNNLDEEFNAFLDWLNTLNDSLESLIKQCQKKS
jgi:hypothetical protein